MKKLENFINCLNILKEADFELAENNDIYRTGIIGQFNLTFELSWKALQAVLKLHGVNAAKTGSPREMLQLAYKYGFVDDEASWLIMLQMRNASIHIYDADKIDEMLYLIRNNFLPAFDSLKNTLAEKYSEVIKEFE